MIEQLLTKSQAARRLNVEIGTLANWEWRGLGPPRIKHGRRVRYPAAQLDAWNERRAVPQQWDRQ